MLISEATRSLLEELHAEAMKQGIEKIVMGGLVLSNGKILLLKRASHDWLPNFVELPSGGVDDDESLIDALSRELLEETGLKLLSAERYMGHFDYITESGKRARQFNFVVSVHEGEVKLDPDEHSEFYWVEPTVESLASYRISEQTLSILRRLASSAA